MRGAGGAALHQFLSGYPAAADSGAQRVLALPFMEPLDGTLDAWLLQQWYDSGSRHYDAFFLQSLPPNLTAAAGGAPLAAQPAQLQYSVLANQTAIHGLPAAITQVQSCLPACLPPPAAALPAALPPLVWRTSASNLACVRPTATPPPLPPPVGARRAAALADRRPARRHPIHQPPATGAGA